MKFQTAITILAGAILVSAVSSEIKMPTPPTPPESPTVQGSTTLERTTKPGKIVAAFTRLDSIRGITTRLQGEIESLKKLEREILAGIPPVSRRDKAYTQQEVDQKAVLIRRILPDLPENSRIEVAFTVSPEGIPTDVKLLSAPATHVDRLTTAVRSWRYAPAVRNDRRVPVRITTTLRITDQ